MDLHQLFRFSVTGAERPYTSAHTTHPPSSSSLFWPLKPNLGSSPNSPFSSHFDSDNRSTSLSESQEQYVSMENISGVSPSCNYSLEGNSSFHQPNLTLDYQRDNSMACSAQTSVVHDVTSSQNIRHALQELESALMATDNEEVTAPSTSFGRRPRPQAAIDRTRAWSQEHPGLHATQSQQSFIIHQQPIGGVHMDRCYRTIEDISLQCSPNNSLKQLLIACAGALSENCMTDFDALIERARGAVSISGEPIQRLGAYMVEGLVARKDASGTSIYRALKCREPESEDLLSYMHILYEICPYLKFGYMAANGAIAEACRSEERIHIIDFQIAQGTQWLTLLQALAARSGGPPHVRITGIDDPVSRYARGCGLEAVERRLKAISEKFNIPVEFHGLNVFGPDVAREMLDVRPGEALAVNFPLQLHHVSDESVDVNNPRDGLLRMVKSLFPKVITLVEQESNTNTTPFLTRFIETLDYYLAMFESIDVSLPRDSKKRLNVEQHCLAKDIVNVIACEGKDRIERHELFGKWKLRLTMAGFQQCPLRSYVNSVIKSLLKCYSEHYTLVERDGAMLLGWKNRNLISASAWH